MTPDQCTLFEAAKTGKFSALPKSLLSVENFLVKNEAERNMSPLQVAAQCGHLDKVPADILTLSNLVDANKDGFSSIHWAAIHGSLNQITFALNLSTLLIPMSSQWTPLHFAAWNNNLDQIPRALLSEYLTDPKRTDNSVLDDAVTNNSIDQLLGFELPESSKEIVGVEWWEKNQAVLRSRSNLTEQDTFDIDIF